MPEWPLGGEAAPEAAPADGFPFGCAAIPVNGMGWGADLWLRESGPLMEAPARATAVIVGVVVVTIAMATVVGIAMMR